MPPRKPSSRFRFYFKQWLPRLDFQTEVRYWAEAENKLKDLRDLDLGPIHGYLPAYTSLYTLISDYVDIRETESRLDFCLLYLSERKEPHLRIWKLYGRFYFSEGAEPGRLRSAELCQSAGGKFILQKSGDGSPNSTATGVLPSFGLPRRTTLAGISSVVFGLISQIRSPRAILAFRSTRPPWAFTVTVEVSSWKSAPRTITGMAI
jgi:hypothetical protein